MSKQTDPCDAVATLQQLVSIPSVNPMGRQVDGGLPYFESRLTDYLQQYFEQLGVAWHRQPVAPERENIVARLDGSAKGLLVFEVHQDTVPVEGMTIDPWTPAIREGRLYGRGACDDKGPMAAMLTAFARLAAERPPAMPTIVMACTVNEESGFTGAAALSQAWAHEADPLLSQRPDAVVVAEPTSFDIVVTHKGVVRWQCETLGRAAHSSYPERGRNAIYAMGPIITACEQYAAQLRRQPPHRLLGTPTISLGTIRGGVSVNTVPDQCGIELDRRLLPHEDPAEARQAAVDWLSAQLPEAWKSCVKHGPPTLSCHGLSEQAASGVAQKLQEVMRSLGHQSAQVGVPYATDAPFFAQLKIPTVVFGPGAIEQAHTADEWISLDAVNQGQEAYYQLAAQWSSS